MWFFNSPQVVYGEGALAFLETLAGQRACIISDANLVKLGMVERIRTALEPSGMDVQVFHDVEPDPSLETVRKGAEFLLQHNPQWIIAVGGGSVLDAAKGMWVLYERPDMDPSGINPIETLHLRQKARFVAIPTTTGTGSEATWAIVLTDSAERRKLGLGSRETMPDIAILDPELVATLPPRLTADTGLDALTHAVEGYTSSFHNDFCDGLCLQAARLVFQYLPRAVADGSDLEARTHTQNAATIAGLGFGNSMAALAHGMGHALGSVFHVPHGRAVALCLPYTIEFTAGGEPEALRYQELAQFLGLPATNQAESATSLAKAIRELAGSLGQPLTLAECGIARADLEREMDLLVQNAMGDTQTIMSVRIPDDEEMKRLFLAAYDGTPVQF